MRAGRCGSSCIDLPPAHTLPAGGRRTATLALLAFAMLIVSLDQYIVVVALPEIGRDLRFSGRTLQLVVSAYAVASAGFLLLGGRSADRLGRRRVLVTGLALYASASLVGGLAAAPLVARAIQGLGGALVFPTTLSLVNTTFAEGQERNRAVAVWGAAGAAGSSSASCSAAFSLRLTALVFTLVEGPNLGRSSPTVMSGAGATFALLITFAAIERASSDPLVSPRLVRNRSSAWKVVRSTARAGLGCPVVAVTPLDMKRYIAIVFVIGFGLLPG